MSKFINHYKLDRTKEAQIINYKTKQFTNQKKHHIQSIQKRDYNPSTNPWQNPKKHDSHKKQALLFRSFKVTPWFSRARFTVASGTKGKRVSWRLPLNFSLGCLNDAVVVASDSCFLFIVFVGVCGACFCLVSLCFLIFLLLLNSCWCFCLGFLVIWLYSGDMFFSVTATLPDYLFCHFWSLSYCFVLCGCVNLCLPSSWWLHLLQEV